MPIASRISPYIQIARPDHWFKNIFVIPGIVAASIMVPGSVEPNTLALRIVLATISVCLVASANYTINEYLDAEYDRLHPLKNYRAAALGLVNGKWVFMQYILLSALGLSIAYHLGRAYLLWSCVLLMMGIIYNVPPLRSKDRCFLDVLSEAINNPLRFLLGWHIVALNVLPPSSILLSYWMGGAFLMAMKRYAEYRYINNAEVAGRYRVSFRHYTEEKLLLSAFFYAISSSLFLGIFLVKHRIEFVLAFPLIAILFMWYLHIAIKAESVAQAPEKLYKEKAFIAYVVFMSACLVFLFFVRMDFLNSLLSVNPIKLK